MFGMAPAYHYRQPTAKEEARRAANMKRRQAREEAADAKRKLFYDNPANMQLMADLHQYAPRNSFAQSMIDAVNIYGSLTDNQLAAAVKMVERRKAQEAERREQNLKLAEQSNHVGTVGERREFVLSIDRLFGFNGHFGYTYGNIMHDSDGNVFVYFGNKLGEQGQAVRGKATIKRHDERDGVKQTVLSRPKMVVIDYSQDDHSTDDIVDDIQAAGAQ